MRYNDGVAIHLDWTRIGRSDKRNDRIVVDAEGFARRNRGGNLAAIARLTSDETRSFKLIRKAYAQQVVDFHSDYTKQNAHAYRLRFEGLGVNRDPRPVQAFAEKLLHRLSPKALIQRHRIIVVARRRPVTSDPQVTLQVGAVLSAGEASGSPLRSGDTVRTLLRDARAGAGGEPSVFVLSRPTPSTLSGHWNVKEAIYLKIKAARAQALLAR